MEGSIHVTGNTRPPSHLRTAGHSFLMVITEAAVIAVAAALAADGYISVLGFCGASV